MIVEGVNTTAGKMTGNFKGANCDGTTFFKMASERGKRSGEGRRVKMSDGNKCFGRLGRLSKRR